MKECVKQFHSECAASKSTVSPSDALADTFISYPKRPNMTESMQVCVKKMFLECAFYIYVHTNP